MTDASNELRRLAAMIGRAHVAGSHPRAILLAGSAAEGVSDRHSDIDLIVYHDRRPGLDVLAAGRETIGLDTARVSAPDDVDAMIVEEFALGGVECQIAHCLVPTWEREMATVIVDHLPGTTIEKAIMGLAAGLPLHGHNLIAQWQSWVAAYPAGLARATVAHYLRFFPLWLAPERWEGRDARILLHQMLAETSLNLLGVLAGLNHRYFSPVQFKRLRPFALTLSIAPDRLADRLDALFTLDPTAAGSSLERLVTETLDLVAAAMPEVDTSAARRHLGMRQAPWTSPVPTDRVTP